MRVALVSFGHSEVSFPLAKALSKKLEIDLFLCFARSWSQQGVIDCTGQDLQTGVLDKGVTQEILGPVSEYSGADFETRIFIYHDLKLRSWRNALLSLRFRKILRGYDIIHFNGQNGVLPQLMLLLWNKAFVFSIHDFDSHSGERTSAFPERFNKFLVRSGREVIIQNRVDFERLSATYKRNVNLNFVPFGVLDVATQFSLPATNGRFESDVLFWGRISPYKGINYLIDAVRTLRLSMPHVRVLIAGSGNGYDFTSLQSEPNFQIINRHLSNTELAEMLQKTKLVVCPYTDATQSGVVMTSFAFNKPVVASAVGGLAEVIEDDRTGKLVPPCDSSKLAAALLELLQNPPKLKGMEDTIQRRKNTGLFSWTNIAERTIGVYRKAEGGFTS